MFGINAEELAQVFTIVGLAIIATFIGIQKLLKDWKATSAETNIITLMHSELERMSEQNSSLSVEVGRLHNEIIVLNNQLQKLTIENQRLQAEVCALTEEIVMFKQLSTKSKGFGHATN